MNRLMALTMMLPRLMADVTPLDATAWQSVMDNLTAQLNVTSIVGVIAALVAACVGFVFLWWGVRKVGRSLITAVKSGRMPF